MQNCFLTDKHPDESLKIATKRPSGRRCKPNTIKEKKVMIKDKSILNHAFSHLCDYVLRIKETGFFELTAYEWTDHAIVSFWKNGKKLMEYAGSYLDVAYFCIYMGSEVTE